MAPRTAPLALILLAAILAPASARAEKTLWTVTCTAAGKVVFVAKLPEDQVNAKAFEVTRARPDATCVFLAADDASSPIAPLQPMEGVTPVSPEADPPALSTGSPGLDTALRALRGVKVPAILPPPPTPIAPAPKETAGKVYEAPPEPADPNSVRPSGGDWVRLGLYSGADKDDAIADWVRIASADAAVFAGLTPDVVETKDYVMLMAGPVSPSEREVVCMSARSLGLDCIFGSEEAIDLDSLGMGDFLAAAGGEDRPYDRRRNLAELEAMEGCGAVHGRQCWRSPFALAEDLTVDFSKPVLRPVAAVRSSPVAVPAKVSAPVRRHKRRPKAGADAQPSPAHSSPG